MVPPPSLAPPAHLSLVRTASPLRRDDIEELTTLLFDLGSGYECALRTVLSMQRLLERVRRSDDLSPESALLIQEMGRQVGALADGSTAIARCLEAAGKHLAGMKGDPAQ
jgi:hypothetical protein